MYLFWFRCGDSGDSAGRGVHEEELDILEVGSTNRRGVDPLNAAFEVVHRTLTEYVHRGCFSS